MSIIYIYTECPKIIHPLKYIIDKNKIKITLELCFLKISKNYLCYI